MSPLLCRLPLLLAFLWLAIGCSQNEAVNRICTEKYKDSLIGRWNCITNESRSFEERQKAEREILAQEAREKAVRPCVAADLNRMEQLAARAIDRVQQSSTLADLRVEFVNLLGAAEITAADDNIKEKVLVARVGTKCDSAFYLLINVRANEQGTIRYAKVWSQNSPQGYVVDEKRFTNDLDEKRRLAEWARNAAENERKRAATLAESKPNSEEDPCAPGISKAERLRRLAQFGVVRETGLGEYQAGGHHVSFLVYGDNVLSCH